MAKILVIEDRASLRALYQIVLGWLDHEVTLASTGEAGLEAASRLRPDLVILDLMLPGIFGPETAEELRHAGILPAPLIITTALGYDEAQAAAKSSGACAVLAKPFDIDAMLAKVHEALSATIRRPATSQDFNPPPLPAGPPRKDSSE